MSSHGRPRQSCVVGARVTVWRVTWVRSSCHCVLQFCCFSWIAFSCHCFSLSISFCFSQILCSIFSTSISSSSTVQCRRDRRRTSRCVPMATLVPIATFCLVPFVAMRPSAHFVARCRGKPRPRPLWEPGFASALIFLLRCVFFPLLISPDFFTDLFFCSSADHTL